MDITGASSAVPREDSSAFMTQLEGMCRCYRDGHDPLQVVLIARAKLFFVGRRI